MSTVPKFLEAIVIIDDTGKLYTDIGIDPAGKARELALDNTGTTFAVFKLTYSCGYLPKTTYTFEEQDHSK